jgi:hypothetical protein
MIASALGVALAGLRQPVDKLLAEDLAKFPASALGYRPRQASGH